MANLTITDQKDGTGAQIQLQNISGGIGVVVVAKYNADVANNPFETVYSGPATDYVQPFETGSYVAIALDSGFPSPPVSFRVTDGTKGTHFECLEAVRQYVLGLSLETYPSDTRKHKIHKRPSNSIQELRDAVGDDVWGCHYWMREETRQPNHNVDEIVTYPIELVMIRSNKHSNIPNPD